MKFLALPPRVAIAAGILLANAILILVLLPVLGGARDHSLEENVRLDSEINQLSGQISRNEDDYAFVVENQNKYEELIQGDRLIPHTRRTAIRYLQDMAIRHGLTTMGYSFTAVGEQSAQAVFSQPQSDLYRVSVENIELTLGAPLDGLVFAFLADALASFPGSAVIQTLELQRAEDITTTALNSVSQGEESGLVTGEVLILWRTAVQNQETGR